MLIKKLIRNGLNLTFSQGLVHRAVSARQGTHAQIFMLHRFRHAGHPSGHDPELLRQFLASLREHHYDLLSVDDLVKRSLAGERLSKAVAFTVDDGYADHAEVGGQIFAEFDCPATFFLITDFIDDTYWPCDAKFAHIFASTPKQFLHCPWKKDDSLLDLSTPEARQRTQQQSIWSLKSQPQEIMEQLVAQLAVNAEVDLPERAPADFRPMSWNDARRLEQSGMRIGAHTRRHVILSAEDDGVARAEIHGSLEAVRKQVQHPSAVFCYPTGRRADFGPRDMDLAAEGGCIAAVSAEPGYFATHSPQQPFSIPRFSLPDNRQDFLQNMLYVERVKEHLRSLI